MSIFRFDEVFFPEIGNKPQKEPYKLNFSGRYADQYEIWLSNFKCAKVHFLCFWGPGKFGLKKGTGVDPPPPRVTMSPFLKGHSVPRVSNVFADPGPSRSFQKSLRAFRGLQGPPVPSRAVQESSRAFKQSVRSSLVTTVPFRRSTLVQLAKGLPGLSSQNCAILHVIISS